MGDALYPLQALEGYRTKQIYFQSETEKSKQAPGSRTGAGPTSQDTSCPDLYSHISECTTTTTASHRDIYFPFLPMIGGRPQRGGGGVIKKGGNNLNKDFFIPLR